MQEYSGAGDEPGELPANLADRMVLTELEHVQVTDDVEAE